MEWGGKVVKGKVREKTKTRRQARNLTEGTGGGHHIKRVKTQKGGCCRKARELTDMVNVYWKGVVVKV